MRRRGLLLGVAVAMVGAGLGSCSAPFEITVFNNSGRDLVLQLETALPWDRSSTRLAAGGRTTLNVVRLPAPGLVLESSGCLYGYDLPPPDRSYYDQARGRRSSAKVQVEPDFSLVLLPEAATAIMPEANELALQARYGFPLRPVSVSCEAPP